MENPHSDLALCKLLGIKYPIIMAPMFLVSNEKMLIAASKKGIAGAIPALNYRTVEELRAGIRTIKAEATGPIGINLIVNASNFLMDEQLQVCCEEKVDFFITSLGSPAKVIEEAHKLGIKVFCDVTDVKYAQKVANLGADAVIAVNNEAGGHLGELSPKALIQAIKAAVSIPVISAGGVGCKADLDRIASYGADGFSIGSIFIASEEADVSQEYKQACVDFGAKDIVTTTKLSGTPCTVIRTPYVKEIGTKQNWLERLLNKNKRIKKWVKAIVFYRGMQSLKRAAFGATYKTVWCAGPSIEHVHGIRSVSQIVDELLNDGKA
ncbi:MAG: 2-nitropropane dioxygenase [Candidatus Fluviicola riflensis]|nr:MAG: 2-nitropropane dioxygenase [Candidatus Fluviicola riflensis]OGS78878.1 MAG: 2-nitropropane dioxygenase [Candidatus Fluviicola riflensis]OGS85900.1 MAG: 2-nitropropane dioxygenase [Fluviicola sp. RIFCSPHIGHO2_12_FULL_43_24]OGS86309.1 MAG: 2-nitropropane dioxygenase [Fluviicola sp. RIFCSPHIGHO2_01_FULL_43_53]